MRALGVVGVCIVSGVPMAASRLGVFAIAPAMRIRRGTRRLAPVAGGRGTLQRRRVMWRSRAVQCCQPLMGRRRKHALCVSLFKFTVLLVHAFVRKYNPRARILYIGPVKQRIIIINKL